MLRIPSDSAARADLDQATDGVKHPRGRSWWLMWVVVSREHGGLPDDPPGSRGHGTWRGRGTWTYSEFWAPWEAVVDTFERVQAKIYGVFEKWSKRGSVFAWRGQVNAAWPLHSSLFRRLSWSFGTPKEMELATAEREILADVHQWGLHMGEYGRLSVMNQLAILQHFGAPTKLIDITFNPWIGLWFAVQERPAREGLPVRCATVRLST